MQPFAAAADAWPQGGAWALLYSPDTEEDQGHLPELRVSEQIQGIP